MWKKISWNQNYSVSDDGQVRNDRTGKIRAQTLCKNNGYYIVDLYKDNKRKKVPVHRLVAEAFIPNPDNKKTVDHKDGNRTNNNVSNLRWATYSEQNSRFGSSGVRSQKVIADHYNEIRKKRGGGHLEWGDIIETKEFSSITDCSKYFGTTISNISLRLEDGNIGRRGKTRGWKLYYKDSKRYKCSRKSVTTIETVEGDE